MENLAGDCILISALQHYLFCPRQFAIIHQEQYWKDNYLTADGHRLHERVDLPGNHRSKGYRVEYSLLLISEQYGLSGRADAVEFLSDGTIMPVEYKHGKEKMNHCDSVQLCAQALCLEEMMRIQVQKGALFYFTTRDRIEILIDDALRNETLHAINDCKAILSGQLQIPPAIRTPRCKSCSLQEYCMPHTSIVSAKAFLQKEIQACENF